MHHLSVCTEIFSKQQSSQLVSVGSFARRALNCTLTHETINDIQSVVCCRWLLRDDIYQQVIRLPVVTPNNSVFFFPSLLPTAIFGHVKSVSDGKVTFVLSKRP